MIDWKKVPAFFPAALQTGTGFPGALELAKSFVFNMVRKGGFEPPQSCDRQPLKLVRLPVPPLPRASKRELCRPLELPISPAARVPVVPELTVSELTAPELIVPELIVPVRGPSSLPVPACSRVLSAPAAPVCR
jgi:hypothetical protein